MRLLAREAAEIDAAADIRGFYSAGPAPLPDGVTEPTDSELSAADSAQGVPGTALQGEVWSCALPTPVGPHPVVVLTMNRIAEPLAAVTVAVVTGTTGPDTTHVSVGPESGLAEYDESFVNCADLQPVAKSRLRRKIGLLAPAELERVEDAMKLILGLRR